MSTRINLLRRATGCVIARFDSPSPSPALRHQLMRSQRRLTDQAVATAPNWTGL